MWKYTRMVVLVALTAAMYAAVLIPFKLLPIIPGITETQAGQRISGHLFPHVRPRRCVGRPPSAT